jgi:glutathione S-transferase
MKLYDYSRSPNARRVRIFLAEKAIEVPVETVDLAHGESHTPSFLSKNPLGQVPLLEFDDGTYLAESVAICRYFEEAQPSPPLFGTTARGRAEVEMWARRIELSLFAPVLVVWKHTDPSWAGRLPQVAALADMERARVTQSLAILDAALAQREFLAGDRFSIADILALCTIEFACEAANIWPDPKLEHLAGWHEAVARRPSARA